MFRRLAFVLPVLGLLLFACSSDPQDAVDAFDRQVVDGADDPEALDDAELARQASDVAEGIEVTDGSSSADGALPIVDFEDIGQGQPDADDDDVPGDTDATPPTTGPPTADECESVPELCIEAGEDLSGQDLNSAVFFESTVSGVNFSNANLADSDFSSAIAIGTNFTGAILTNAIIEGADLTGSDFTDADLTDAFVADTDLTRVVWSNTTCPDGSNSDQNGDSCVANF